MNPPNRNILQARIIVDQLVKSGVENACVTPGSRNTPLTVALTERDDVTVHTHVDERSSAFFALGQAKATGIPTVIACTSGTATAEYHPAVIEANEARVPLIVLTADRPPELHRSGSNQTVDQAKLFGDSTRFFHDPGLPEDKPRYFRSLATITCKAFRQSQTPLPGPVHLNLPFRKPLEPVQVEGDLSENTLETYHNITGTSEPHTSYCSDLDNVKPGEAKILGKSIQEHSRGLIYAGGIEPYRQSPKSLEQLTELSGYPILADPLSGIRYSEVASDVTVLGGYEHYIDPRYGPPSPDIVIQVGGAPTASRALRRFFDNIRAKIIRIPTHSTWPDSSFTAGTILESNLNKLIEELVHTEFAESVNENWKETWNELEQNTVSRLSNVSPDHPQFEGFYVRDLVSELPDGSTLFVGNSLPIRDLSRFVPTGTTQLKTLGNRGASGIDGLLATGLGLSSVSDQVTILVGDLSFLHDLNSLISLTRMESEINIVLINNNGGGIFHMLPIEDYDPPFEEYVKTPHDMDLESLCEPFGLSHKQVENRKEFRDAYRELRNRSGSGLIEVFTDPESSQSTREKLTGHSN
ncbi:MAG: 2-succinyl-5-enolpyruvyl-6-hydroxy-3-cyclohexene-1-carboxylic-acid synthase [bacterium]